MADAPKRIRVNNKTQDPERTARGIGEALQEVMVGKDAARRMRRDAHIDKVFTRIMQLAVLTGVVLSLIWLARSALG